MKTILLGIYTMAMLVLLSQTTFSQVTVVEEPSNAESKQEEETESDPRAALMSMLNKRSPPTPAVDESKTKAEETKDPRAALMSMLNKRSPPIPADEPENKADDQESETKEADPRAALMSMISKRAPPQPTEESKSAAPQSSSTDTTTADKASAGKDEVLTIRNDPRFTKYFKMLKMVRSDMILWYLVLSHLCMVAYPFVIFSCVRGCLLARLRMQCNETTKIQL